MSQEMWMMLVLVSICATGMALGHQQVTALVTSISSALS